MENGEMRMLSEELRVVRLWHSGLERVGRTAVRPYHFTISLITISLITIY